MRRKKARLPLTAASTLCPSAKKCQLIQYCYYNSIQGKEDLKYCGKGASFQLEGSWKSSPSHPHTNHPRRPHRTDFFLYSEKPFPAFWAHLKCNLSASCFWFLQFCAYNRQSQGSGVWTLRSHFPHFGHIQSVFYQLLVALIFCLKSIKTIERTQTHTLRNELQVLENYTFQLCAFLIVRHLQFDGRMAYQGRQRSVATATKEFPTCLGSMWQQYKLVAMITDL